VKSYVKSTVRLMFMAHCQPQTADKKLKHELAIYLSKTCRTFKCDLQMWPSNVIKRQFKCLYLHGHCRLINSITSFWKSDEWQACMHAHPNRLCLIVKATYSSPSDNSVSTVSK
jgi:hypothetical protein